jgi:hypothetical protein
MRQRGFGILGFILLIAVLWLLWYYTGGPERYNDYDGPYINPPAPLGDGQTYGPPL